VHIFGELSVDQEMLGGSTASIHGRTRIIEGLVVEGITELSSRLSVSSEVDIGAGLSIVGPSKFHELEAIGSVIFSGAQLIVTVPVSQFTGLSTSGPAFINEASVNENAVIGGSLSVTQSLMVSSNLRVETEADIKGNVSLSGWVAAASGLCIAGHSSIGDNCDIFGSASIAGNLYAGSFSELLGSLSVHESASFGSGTSVLGRLLVDGSISLSGPLRLSSGVSVYSGSAVAVTLDESGGHLHGIWESDFTITTSDRRLKRNIAPLGSNLGSVLLDLLRPVSFELVNDEAGTTRYGFIAQELEQVLPELVMTLNQTADSTGTKAVLYQDLIAVLTAIVQAQDSRIRNLLQEAEGLQSSVKRLGQEAMVQRAELEERKRKESERDERMRRLEVAIESLSNHHQGTGRLILT
jgi:cytoskeletal protein CcmA (bactofilin family)